LALKQGRWQKMAVLARHAQIALEQQNYPPRPKTWLESCLMTRGARVWVCQRAKGAQFFREREFRRRWSHPRFLLAQQHRLLRLLVALCGSFAWLIPWLE
jgi:hypothetical protein